MDAGCVTINLTTSRLLRERYVFEDYGGLVRESIKRHYHSIGAGDCDVVGVR